MKIWRGYGSEHSSNLVMIGRFKTVAGAAEAKRIIDRLTEQIRADVKAGLMDETDPPQRFTDHIMELFKEVETYIVAPAELSQFNYEFSVEVQGRHARSDDRGIRYFSLPENPGQRGCSCGSVFPSRLPNRERGPMRDDTRW